MKTLPKGFKDSDIGPIPQDWEVGMLGEVCHFVSGSVFPEKYQGVPQGKYPFAKVSDMSLPGNERSLHSANNYIDDGIAAKLKVSLVPPKSTVFAKVGAALLLNRRRLSVVTMCIDNNMAAACPNRDTWYEYLFYLLQSIDLSKYCQEGALPSINTSTLQIIPVPSVTLEEQQAIAGALSDIDALISAQEELLAKKRAIKQGAMQELLTGRRRLPGFPVRPMKQTDIGPIPEDWEVKELGALCNLIKESGIPEPNGYCIELENIESNTGRLCGEVQKCIHATRFHYKADDVLYGRLRAYLQKYYYGRENGWCSTEIWVLRASDVASGFLRYLVASSRFAEAAAVTHGTHMPRSEWKVVEKTLFGIPSSISEQVAIAAVLSDMDAEITAVEEELAKHRALKRGMMQELLSGRIRLPYKKSTHRKQNAGE